MSQRIKGKVREMMRVRARRGEQKKQACVSNLYSWGPGTNGIKCFPGNPGAEPKLRAGSLD